MKQAKGFSWMIRPRGFVKLLGGEYDLMQRAGGRVLLKFYASSISILLIAVLTFLSTRYAVELLFHIVAVEIGLSFFLSGLFVLMYIFIINTFSKEIRKSDMFGMSNITRVGFVIFMGFILSKPIEAYFYKAKLDDHIVGYRKQLNLEHAGKINQLFDVDIDKMLKQKKHYEQLYVHDGFSNEIAKLSQSINLLDQKKQKLISSSESRIDNAEYFIYRVKTVSGTYPLSWLVCLVIILFFLLPGYLIYSISTDDEYYRMKNEQEKRLVGNAYTAFTEKYTTLFKKHDMELDFYSKYEDPPFNTILKKDPAAKPASDFYNRFGIQ